MCFPPAFYLPRGGLRVGAAEKWWLTGGVWRAGTGFGGDTEHSSHVPCARGRSSESQAVRASGPRPLNGAAHWNCTLVTQGLGLVMRASRSCLARLGGYVSFCGPNHTPKTPGPWFVVRPKRMVRARLGYKQSGFTRFRSCLVIAYD